MTTVSASFWRDANRVPITTDGLTITDSQTFTTNNGTATIPLFRVTGTVEVRGLWGVVTTVLSSNITAAYWRLNDQTAQSDITVSTGTTLSSAAVGSVIVKKDVAANALVFLSASQERVSEPTTLEHTYFSPFLAVKKPSANTDIEFSYACNNQSSGAIQFFCRFLPLSVDGNLTPQ